MNLAVCSDLRCRIQFEIIEISSCGNIFIVRVLAKYFPEMQQVFLRIILSLISSHSRPSKVIYYKAKVTKGSHEKKNYEEGFLID